MRFRLPPRGEARTLIREGCNWSLSVYLYGNAPVRSASTSRSVPIGSKNVFNTYRNMPKIDSNTEVKVYPRFQSQWAENAPYEGQRFEEPSMTVPDQSLTIPEIIARFTRTGLVPALVKMQDQGGNVALDPESDPMDDWNEAMSAAAAAKAAAGSSTKEPSVAPDEGESAHE